MKTYAKIALASYERAYGDHIIAIYCLTDSMVSFFGRKYWLQLSGGEGAHVVTFLVSFFFKLENEKAEHAKEMRGLERQIAQLRDQLLKARRGLEDQARVSSNLF